MKSQMGLATAVIAVAACAALWGGRTTFAQEEQGEASTPRAAGAAVFIDPVLYSDRAAPARKQMLLRSGNESYHVWMHGPHDAIRKAAEELGDAKGDEAKEAREKLTALLEQYFEDDMTHRESELRDIEKRLGKLRAQLERRREKKDEIIELQVKVAVNEAEGLGFFGAPGGYPGQPFGFGNPPPPPPAPGYDAMLVPARPGPRDGVPGGERPRGLR